MRNNLNPKGLFERGTGRTLLAFSLVTSLAAFGCTTNRTPGNGEPLRSAPSVGPAAPTSGVTSGSSRGGTVTYQPMMSSSQHIEPLPGVTTRAKRLPLTPDEAAAIMAGNQFGRGARVLGPVNPGTSRHVYVSDRLDPFDRPASGIITVNSSINSAAHVEAIAADGAGSAGVISGVTGASTIAGRGTVATTGAPLTPTTATLPMTAGSFAAGPVATTTTPAVSTGAVSTGTLTPTVSSSFVPSPTASSSATVSPVRIIQNANGQVTVTNSGSSPRR